MTSDSSGSPVRPPPAAPSLREEMAAWLDRERAFHAARSHAEQRAAAAALPLEPAAHPEVHALQCSLLLRAWPLGAFSRLPDWQQASLPASSRISWSRLALLVEPERAVRSRDRSLPWAVLLDGLDLLTAPEPLAVLRALLADPDGAPRRHALDALRGLVSRGFATITAAHALLLSLLQSEDVGLRTGALRELAAPWAAGLPVPSEALERGLLAEDDGEALAATEAAGLREALKPGVLLRHGSVARRKAAVRWAGRLGDGATVGALLEVALDDPAEMGDSVFPALIELHHRGHFVREEHAADVLELLHRGLSWDSDRLAALCFVARRPILEKVESLDADDPDWVFLIPLLAAWLRAPRPPAGLFELLLRTGRSATRPSVIAEVLRSLRTLAIDVASAPREAIEELSLATLRDFPDLSLDLLAVVAGRAAREELLRRSGWEQGSRADASLQQHWSRVFPVLWHTSSEAERLELLSRARPVWLTDEMQRSLYSKLPAPARDLLRRRRTDGWSGDGENIESLFVRLTEIAAPDDLDEILLAMRRTLEKAVSRPWRLSPAASMKHPWSQGAGSPLDGGEELWQLPRRCVEAVDAMEARWRLTHRRPACLLGSGKRLLPELLLALLADAGPAALRAGVLRSLLSLEHPLLAARGAEALLHRDADVAKLGARLLARRGAPWLSLELTRGVESGDERRIRACLEALTAGDATWGIPSARRCLSHRNMNLKKTAAEALGRVATPDCAPDLLRWLGHHDNPGFRTALKAALRRALGTAYLPAMLAAIHEAGGDDRRVGLLLEALDGEVDAPLVRRLSRQPAPWLGRLLAALRDGTIALARGSLEDIAPELAAAGMPLPARPTKPEEKRRDPFDDAVDTLFHEGFDPDRAEAVLARWPASLPARAVEKLRPSLRAWLDWMIAREDARPAPLIQAVLQGPRAPETELIERAAPGLVALFDTCPPERTAACFALLEALFPGLGPLDRLDLGERLRRRLGELPGLERSPLHLITRCGVQLRREDAERAFLGVRGVPAPAQVRRQILAEAFSTRGSPLPAITRDTSPLLDEESAAEDWAGQLSAALRARGPSALAKLRAEWPFAGEMTLRALIHELPDAAPVNTVCAAAFDWMEQLRPAGVAAWAWPRREGPDPRRARPRKAPALLDHEARLARLGAWLAGEDTAPWSPTGTELDEYLPPEITPLLPRARLDRLLELVAHRRPTGPLREVVESLLLDRWGELSPVQTAVLARVRGDARPLLGASWAGPDDPETERRALRRLLETEIEIPAASLEEATEDNVSRWLVEARGADEEAARRALSRLAENPDDAWRALALELVERGTPRVRHHALRLIRKTLPQSDTLAAARTFLDDEDPSARRMAIRIVCHGGDREALPKLVERLVDPVAWVRREALEGLALMAEDAVPAVVRAKSRARPDQARTYEQALSVLRRKLP